MIETPLVDIAATLNLALVEMLFILTETWNTTLRTSLYLAGATGMTVGKSPAAYGNAFCPVRLKSVTDGVLVGAIVDSSNCLG
jgi:hypothetical protein